MLVFHSTFLTVGLLQCLLYSKADLTDIFIALVLLESACIDFCRILHQAHANLEAHVSYPLCLL